MIFCRSLDLREPHLERGIIIQEGVGANDVERLLEDGAGPMGAAAECPRPRQPEGRVTKERKLRRVFWSRRRGSLGFIMGERMPFWPAEGLA